MTTVFDALDNALFRNNFNTTIDRAGASLGAQRVHAALDSVDLNQVSSSEKRVLQSLAGSLSSDGYISGNDADALVSLIHGYATPNSPFGMPAPTPAHTPINAPIRMPVAYPGSALFADIFTQLVNQAVQSFRNAAFLGSAANMLAETDQSAGAQRVADALDNADLSRFSADDRHFILSLIGYASADGHISRAEANIIIDYIQFASGNPGNVATQPWNVETNDGQHARIDLGNYTLDIDQSSSQFVLTNKATGEVTRIWGDPHFDNNGQAIGTFKGTLTLSLDDGTKLTINTTPAGNGEFYSSKLTITQGDQAIVVDHLNQNSNQPLSIIDTPILGRLLDWATDDGTRVYEDTNTRQWVQLDAGGWTHTIDGSFLAKS